MAACWARPCSAVRHQSVLNVSRDGQERIFNAEILFCGSLEELDLVLLSQRLALLEGHGAVLHVALVADKHLIYINIGVLRSEVGSGAEAGAGARGGWREKVG